MKSVKSLRSFVTIAMLAAVSGVLMSFEVSVPMMPPFYKLDFSDVPTVIGLFSYGPWAAFAIEMVKILIKLVTVGTSTAFVGEFANVISAFFFICPIWFIYSRMGKTVKTARWALGVSVPVRTAFACFVNAYITLPLYARAMGIEVDAVVRMVAAVNPAIVDLRTFIVFATIPFNLIKIAANAVIGFELYRRLSPLRVLPANLQAAQVRA